MKLLFIILLLPVFSIGQVNVSDSNVVTYDTGPFFTNPNYDTTYISDTLEATLFVDFINFQIFGNSQIARQKILLPIAGYVVIVKGRIKFKSMGSIGAYFPLSEKMICYLDKKKFLINTVNVWDYKLREK